MILDVSDAAGTNAELNRQLAQAVEAGDAQRADQLLEQLGRYLSGENLLIAAQAHMWQQRWAEASRLLGRVIDRTPEVEMHRRYAANLAAMSQRHPRAYQAVMAVAGDTQNYAIIQQVDRPDLIARVDAEGRQTTLGDSNDPLASAQRLLAPMQDQRVDSLALAGIGDGYALTWLQTHEPDLLLTMKQTVHIVETDAELVRTCLMLHDWSGKGGALRDERFQWFVGPTASQAFGEALLSDPFVAPPGQIVQQGAASGTVAEIQQALRRYNQRVGELQQRIDQYYLGGEFDPAAALSGRAGRPARVLTLTTRFSTVLQHSARDTAQAFEAMGWQSRLSIEPSDHQRQNGMSFRAVMADYKPDLVVVIDHLRHEYGEILPESLPLISWIQDYLPPLVEPDSGRSVGGREFVLADRCGYLVANCGYPAAQCIDVAKATRLPERPASWTSNGDDLVYVSHASQTPEELVADVVGAFTVDQTTQRFAEACVRRLIDVYAVGGCVQTDAELIDLVERAGTELGMTVPPQARDALVSRLRHPVNNALYRQQALRWAASVAEKLDLSLAIYGRGWAKHPQLGRYHRGEVAYGPELEELTRASRINLQIVPFHLLHQRLLDGLAAGGFFLVRSHPSDTVPLTLANLLVDYGVDGSVATVAGAREALPDEARATFDGLVEQCRRCLCATESDDPLAIIRGFERAGLMQAGESPLPHYDQVSFHDETSLLQSARYFMDDEPLRRQVSEAQLDRIKSTLTYEAAMRRVAERVTEALQE